MKRLKLSEIVLMSANLLKSLAFIMVDYVFINQFLVFTLCSDSTLRMGSFDVDSLELLPNCQNSFLTPLPALNDSDLIPLISVCTKPANTTYFDNNNHFTMLMFRTNDNIDLKNALIATFNS